MNNICFIGSGPSSLLTCYYLYKNYSDINCTIIAPNFDIFHCTYGVFIEQIENTWLFDYFDKKLLFSNIVNTDTKFINHKSVILSKKYGIINNNYLHKEIINFLKSTNIKFCIGNVYYIKNIEKNSYYKYKVLYRNKSYFNFILCNKIIEAIGDNFIGKTNNFHNYYQHFVGYKIKLKNPHKIKKCTLLDWNKSIFYENNHYGNNHYGNNHHENNDYENNHHENTFCKSFCYILPFNKNTVLVEETILSTSINKNFYKILNKRLLKRLEKLGFKEYIIKDKEIYKIPLIKSIQNSNKNNYSFKIGVCGNMINNICGYSIGYNIYHIPEYSKYIYYFNSHNKMIQNYWCFKRKIIYFISIIGLELMEDLTQDEMSEFHYYYFKYIVNTYNFKIMFLNCDNDFSYIKFILSFYNYIYFPKKYLWKISKICFNKTIQKLNIFNM